MKKNLLHLVLLPEMAGAQTVSGDILSYIDESEYNLFLMYSGEKNETFENTFIKYTKKNITFLNLKYSCFNLNFST